MSLYEPLPEDFLLQFIPSFLQDVKEYEYILKDASMPMINIIDQYYHQLVQDYLIKIATIDGIELAEKYMGIIPSPTLESVEFRRTRLLSRLTAKPPYTERYLPIYLSNYLAADGYSIDFDYANYAIAFAFTAGDAVQYREMVRMLRELIPANIQISTYGSTFDTMMSRVDGSWTVINYWYRLGGQWSLGMDIPGQTGVEAPFGSETTPQEVDYRMSTFTPYYFNSMATSLAATVNSVTASILTVGGATITVDITEFSFKAAVGSSARFGFTVLFDNSYDSVSQFVYKSSDGHELFVSDLYLSFRQGQSTGTDILFNAMVNFADWITT